MQEQPMRRCPNGHYYGHEHAVCPFCGGGSLNANINVTQPANYGPPPAYNSPPPANIGPTVPATGVQRPFIDRTQPGNAFAGGDGDKTQVGIRRDLGMDPVVGWLVCIEGREKGRDHRIHSDYNYIGRGENMDICVRDDAEISRENHAVLAYDTQAKTYYFNKGPDGRGIVRLNGEAVMESKVLKAYDTIQLGNTKLIFVPLCGEGFDWLN